MVARRADRFLKNLLVTPMYAVEIAHGHHRIGPERSTFSLLEPLVNLLEAVDDLHIFNPLLSSAPFIRRIGKIQSVQDSSLSEIALAFPSRSRL
jgi:hypothetical protein